MNQDRLMGLLVQHLIDVKERFCDPILVLTEQQPATTAAAPALCWKLMHILRAYQMLRHSELLNSIRMHDDARVSTSARALGKLCLALVDKYAKFVERWSRGDSSAAWHEHREQAKSRISGTDQHLMSEREAVCNLTFDADRIRHRVTNIYPSGLLGNCRPGRALRAPPYRLSLMVTPQQTSPSCGIILPR